LSESDSNQGTVFVVETLIGVFGVTEGNDVVERVLFPPDPKQISTALDRQSAGEATKEVGEVVEKLKQRGFKKFVFSNRALAEAVGVKFDIHTEVGVASGPADHLRGRLEGFAVEYGLVENITQFFDLSHEVSMLRAGRAVQRAQSGRAAVITQTVQLINELDKTLNVLSGKLREWYGLHFPELSRHVESHETYAKIVKVFGDRDSLSADALGELGLKGRKPSTILNAAKKSMGAPLAPGDVEHMKTLASNLLSLYDYRQELEALISSAAAEVAPNLSEVAGSMLAAKLIERAGGLTKLAMMPSSTVQLLGAEKALFRAKKSRSKPPKHGLVFQHPYIHSKPRDQRGRAARILASKLAIAARADAFTGNPIGAELRKTLDDSENVEKNPTRK